MVKLIKSITKSIRHGLKNDPEVQRLHQKYPRFFNFIKKRLTPDEKFGLYLTIGSLISLTFIYFFIKIIHDYLSQESIIRSDYRLLSVFKMFRTPLINNVMLFITYLGKGETIVFSLIIVSIILILLKQRFYLFSLIASVSLGELFVYIVKNTIDRPRPLLADALVIENTWSFPSGHTFTAISFYGLLTFFIAHNLKKRWQRFIAYTIGLLLIIVIGVSRIFLGAHWPSDVLASFVFGIAWLSILVTIASIRKKFSPKEITEIKTNKKRVIKASPFLIISWLLFVTLFYKTHPFANIPQNTDSQTITVTQIDQDFLPKINKYSETLNGRTMEPIGIVVVATEDNLTKSFTDAGWYKADKINFTTVFRQMKRAVFKQSYPEIYGTPSFWNSKINDIAFQKPTTVSSMSYKHHVHFWKTQYVDQNGTPIWVGTGHFDQGWKFYIWLVHTIDPAIDKERTTIKDDLERINKINSFHEYQFVEPSLGKNVRDVFFTDGKVAVIKLKP